MTSNQIYEPLTFEISPSKSLLNRWLIIQSYAPDDIQIDAHSDCDDVRFLEKSLSDLSAPEFFCGSGGTTLRFLAMRLSRIPGRHKLVGSERLMARPHDGLVRIMQQLGCQVEINSQAMIIDSVGWRPRGDMIYVPMNLSSQFASSLLLNSWSLPMAIPIVFEGQRVSNSYLEMTQSILKSAGWRCRETANNTIYLLPHVNPHHGRVQVEADVSSAACIALLGGLAGPIEITNFPVSSVQADKAILSVMNQLGIQWSFAPLSNSVQTPASARTIHLPSDSQYLIRVPTQKLSVSKCESMSGIRLSLKDAPDLLPVLAITCAFAGSESELFDLDNANLKESPRLDKTAELLSRMGSSVLVGHNQLRIKPIDSLPRAFCFDPDHDHRMAMAAALAKARGVSVTIENPEVVSKSFPNFWEQTGIDPC